MLQADAAARCSQIGRLGQIPCLGSKRWPCQLHSEAKRFRGVSQADDNTVAHIEQAADALRKQGLMLCEAAVDLSDRRQGCSQAVRLSKHSNLFWFGGSRVVLPAELFFMQGFPDVRVQRLSLNEVRELAVGSATAAPCIAVVLVALLYSTHLPGLWANR